MTSNQARTIKIGQKVVRIDIESKATLEVISISRLGSGNCVFQVWEESQFRAFWIHSDKVRKVTGADLVNTITEGR